MMKLHLYKKLISQSFQEMFSYRLTTVLVIVFGFLFFGIELLTGLIYFDFVETLNGWNRQDYLLLLTTSSLIVYLYQFFFVVSHENLTETILEGELDYTFLRPVNSFWFYALNRLDVATFINVFIVGIVNFYFLCRYSINIATLGIYLFLVFAGVWFVFLLNQIVVMVSFWKEGTGKLIAVPEYLTDFSSRPMTVYPRFIQLTFSFLCPTLVCMNLPVEWIKREFSFSILIYFLCFETVLTFLTLSMWKKGIAKYQSAN